MTGADNAVRVSTRVSVAGNAKHTPCRREVAGFKPMGRESGACARRPRPAWFGEGGQSGTDERVGVTSHVDLGRVSDDIHS